MAFADDVVTVLEDASVGTPAEELFIGSTAILPNGDGPYLSVIPTQGVGAIGVHGNPRHIRRPRAQVVCRAKRATLAEDMAAAAHQAITRVFNQPVGSQHYLAMRALQEPFDLGPDDRGRNRTVFNIEGDYQGSR